MIWLRLLAGAVGVLSLGAGLFWIRLIGKLATSPSEARRTALFLVVGALGYFAFGALFVAAAVWRLNWAVGAAGGVMLARIAAHRLIARGVAPDAR